MEKTRENVQYIIEYVIDREEVSESFPVERFVTAYLEGKDFVPETEREAELAGYIDDCLWTEFERYSPDDKEAWRQNAERIPVIISGREFQTFLDEKGVQRFVGNAVMRRILDSMRSDDKISLNTLSIDHQNGMFSSDEWLDFYTSFGYSVSGFMSLSAFSHLPIHNPLWEIEDDA